MDSGQCCGSFEISGSRSLGSSPIGSVEFFFLGLVLPSPLLTTEEGDACDSTSCSSEGAWPASSTVESAFGYFSAVFRSTIQSRSIKTNSNDAKAHEENGNVSRSVVHQASQEGRSHDPSVHPRKDKAYPLPDFIPTNGVDQVCKPHRK